MHYKLLDKYIINNTKELESAWLSLCVFFQVVLQFLLDYPLGKKLPQHITFYLDNLDYELQHGRESIYEMIGAILTAFPQVNIIYEILTIPSSMSPTGTKFSLRYFANFIFCLLYHN